MVRVKNDRRTKVSNVDYEKGAVVYQTLFVRKKNVHAIKSSDFEREWRKKFDEDDLDIKVIRAIFNETVQKAGKDKQSIKKYRESFRISSKRKIPKEILDLTVGKCIYVQVAKNIKNGKNPLSGYRIMRKGDNVVIRFPDYSGTEDQVIEFLNKSPNEEKMLKSESSLLEILMDENTSYSKKADALHKYDINICSHKFATKIEKLIRKTPSQQILHEALNLANRIGIKDMRNSHKLIAKVNKNAHVKLEKIPPFNNKQKVSNMVDAIVRETNLTEVDCKNKEQMKTLKKALFKLYPKEADVLNDRCGTPQLFGNWISKYIEETVTTVIGE